MQLFYECDVLQSSVLCIEIKDVVEWGQWTQRTEWGGGGRGGNSWKKKKKFSLLVAKRRKQTDSGSYVTCVASWWDSMDFFVSLRLKQTVTLIIPLWKLSASAGSKRSFMVPLQINWTLFRTRRKFPRRRTSEGFHHNTKGEVGQGLRTKDDGILT